MRVAYLIPEFPGQTHTWIWREILCLREWGVEIALFSTRPPTERDRSRDTFAAEALRNTRYLGPRLSASLVSSAARAALKHPSGIARSLKLGFTLPVDGGKRWRRVVPLLAPAAALARAVEKSGATHLHVHSCANAAIIAMMVKRLTGIPFSLTVNANIDWWGGAMAEKFGDAAFTVSHTEWLLAQMKRDFPGLRSDQVVVARVGVDTRRWKSSRPLAASDEGRIVTIGRLHASKGHDVLLRALKQLVDAGRRVSLRVIGAGPERQALERQAKMSDLDRAVTFMGTLSEDEIIKQLETANLFVLASHAEPLGVVYMEAMAMEVPPIGTDAGGVGEIITNEVDGLLVPPGDPDALAAAIGKLLDDPDLRRRIGVEARRTVVERFDARLGAAMLFSRIFGHPPEQTAATA